MISVTGHADTVAIAEVIARVRHRTVATVGERIA
jgi:hypothetical protein